jgi:hypothetical protein
MPAVYPLYLEREIDRRWHRRLVPKDRSMLYALCSLLALSTQTTYGRCPSVHTVGETYCGNQNS